MNKKILLLMIVMILPALLLIFLVTNFDNTETNYNDMQLDTAFEISNYYITANVDNNRNVDIVEAITVNFLQPRSSILRDIPISGGAQIKNIKVEDREFSVEKYGSFYTVDLDSSNYNKSTGETLYVLSYTLILPKMKNAQDSIPLNIVGQGWGSPIRKAEIVITLPEVPVSSEYYVGKQNTATGDERLDISQNNKTINIKTKDTLKPFEGITVGYDLPKGTLNSPIDLSLLPKIIIAFILIGLCYVVYMLFGKDDEIFPIVNFDAKGLTPAEAGYLVDGNCSPSDLTSLIYYWASKGYLNIIDAKNGSNISLEKIKNLDSTHKRYEHTLFNGLFKNKSTVSINSLKNTFYTVISSATAELKSEYAHKLYEQKSFMLAILACVIPAVFAGLSALISGFSVSSNYFRLSGFAFIIPSVIVFFAGTFIFTREQKHIEQKTLLYGLYALLIIILSIIMTFVLKNMLYPKGESYIYVACFAIIASFAPFIQKRTKFYNEQLNDLVGFRNFIKEAEKEKLEMMLAENPQYYYDILPYANVLGVSNEWMNKFKALTVEPPNWYRSNTAFNFLLFNAAFSRSMTTITTTAVSRPSNAGRGGTGFGGGGGFSGGGFGGGGGRSR